MGKVVELNREDNQNVCRFVWARMRSKKYITNILLACTAVALEVYSSICGGSCSYLKGDLFRIPLQYIGIAYMACIVFFSILKWDRLLLVLLSAGVGIEIYLIGFQIWHNTYCPYCLAFGGIIFLLFLLNIDRNRKKLSVISMGLALILFSIFFEGSVTPSYADEVALLPISPFRPQQSKEPPHEHRPGVHMEPAEAVQAHLDLRAHVSIASHFQVFQLGSDGFYDAVNELTSALKERNLKPGAFIVPKFGLALKFATPLTGVYNAGNADPSCHLCAA
jgi:uncharacterized membrane protein